MLPAGDRARIKSGAASPIDMHHGLGMYLRNQWGLWSGSRLADYFHEMGIHHPDDMSGIILDSYVRHLRGDPFSVHAKVREYQEYWAKFRAPAAKKGATTVSTTTMTRPTR